jgi:hypothetical protein
MRSLLTPHKVPEIAEPYNSNRFVTWQLAVDNEQLRTRPSSTRRQVTIKAMHCAPRVEALAVRVSSQFGSHSRAGTVESREKV